LWPLSLKIVEEKSNFRARSLDTERGETIQTIFSHSRKLIVLTLSQRIDNAFTRSNLRRQTDKNTQCTDDLRKHLRGSKFEHSLNKFLRLATKVKFHRKCSLKDDNLITNIF
jgi:hypothetical protein